MRRASCCCGSCCCIYSRHLALTKCICLQLNVTHADCACLTALADSPSAQCLPSPSPRRNIIAHIGRRNARDMVACHSNMSQWLNNKLTTGYIRNLLQEFLRCVAVQASDNVLNSIMWKKTCVVINQILTKLRTLGLEYSISIILYGAFKIYCRSLL